MNRTESLAKAIIEQLIPGSTLHYHPEQAGGLHDFDLRYPDGVIVPLEVTAAANRQINETTAAIASRRNGGRFIEARACQNGWIVHPLPDANVNRLRRQVDVFLARIEAAGFSKFVACTDAGELEPVRDILTQLRVEAGSVFLWKGGRQICIATPGQGGRVTSDHVQRAVELEANKQDNRVKLARAAALEAHLVLCVDSMNFLPWVSLVDGTPPSSPPALPLTSQMYGRSLGPELLVKPLPGEPIEPPAGRRRRECRFLYLRNVMPTRILLNHGMQPTR